MEVIPKSLGFNRFHIWSTHYRPIRVHNYNPFTTLQQPVSGSTLRGSQCSRTVKLIFGKQFCKSTFPTFTGNNKDAQKTKGGSNRDLSIMGRTNVAAGVKENVRRSAPIKIPNQALTFLSSFGTPEPRRNQRWTRYTWRVSGQTWNVN